jgi:TPP-dependent pyruvate/acetoin dehydrogenase alpha subunit
VGWFEQADAERIEREAAEEVQEAVEFARQSDYPDSGLLTDLVYAKER